ncbi:MAG: MBOAT family O-acyltransferase [Smithella sp.]|nr:MBOAT family O-acyltransferase [Smithella sp.]
MQFASFQFALFVAVVAAIHFVTPGRWRWLILLIASYFFYAFWQWEFLFLLLGVSVVNWFCALRIEKNASKFLRRLYLLSAIVASLGALFFFKYYNFAQGSLSSFIHLLGGSATLPVLQIILPVGLSFYTFQGLSYTLDVYFGKEKAERHFGRLALFVAFFPKLVSGPIDRAGNLLKQIQEQDCHADQESAHNYTFNFDQARVVSGLQLILWGLFKKLVIADRLSIYVNQIFSDPGAFSGPSLLLAAYFFTFQIYCDFSGYTDIAIGTSRLMGYDLVPNFRLPYFATSITDFWRRWHISLSTWFRDYLYIPLGGNRVENLWRWALVIMIVFVASGLWHGAAWAFVIWGTLHGAFYLMGRLLSKPGQRFSAWLRLPAFVGKWFRIFVTFHAVALAWVFFRAKSVEDAWIIIKGIFTKMDGPFYTGASQLTTALSLCFILFLIAVQLMQMKGWIPLYRYSEGRPWPLPVRWLAYAVLIFGISVFGVSSNQFIYFQF